MRYRLRTLLIWPVVIAAWWVLIKTATYDWFSPAYRWRESELLVVGVVLAGLTVAVAAWTVKSPRSISN
jgi:hypothetical protein